MTTDETGAGEDPSSSTEGEEPPWPIGFMLLVGLAALYVGWRLIQITGRAVGWLF